MKHLPKFALSAVILTLLSLSNVVYADDSKVYPGASCQPQEPPQTAPNIQTFENLIFYDAEPGADNAIVICPIVRDRLNRQDGTKEVSVYVKSANGAQLTCQLFSVTTTGEVVESNSASTTSDQPVSLALDVNTSTNDGFYSIKA